ncbi:MAG: alpha/beta hydrolase [Candidatus Omnitrophica bacterium]|nr:alpha/beta hydrolase [Candidatus Omnitrophota bacterium]
MAYLVTNRNLKWYYEISGSGEPIIFIHGFGGSSRWWSAQKAFFETDYHVLTVDLPGHGQSSWGMVNLKDMAMDLRQMINTLDLDRINIVASSFGGLVALELYPLISKRTLRISFVGSIPKFARGPSYPAGLDIDRIRELSQQFEGDYASILDIFFRSLFTVQERESAAFKTVQELRDNDVLPQREALKIFLDILEKADLRHRLASLVCPVQFITGTEDYICPKAVMEWVGEHIPHARLDFIDGCGHLPFLTKATPYNDLLESFLIN